MRDFNLPQLWQQFVSQLLQYRALLCQQANQQAGMVHFLPLFACIVTGSVPFHAAASWLRYISPFAACAQPAASTVPDGFRAALGTIEIASRVQFCMPLGANRSQHLAIFNFVVCACQALNIWAFVARLIARILDTKQQ
jgi:hypothetical protein